MTVPGRFATLVVSLLSAVSAVRIVWIGGLLERQRRHLLQPLLPLPPPPLLQLLPLRLRQPHHPTMCWTTTVEIWETIQLKHVSVVSASLATPVDRPFR